MDENIFKYGSYDVDKGTLLKSLQYENNIRSFSRHKRYTPEQESEFRDIVQYLQNGIQNNTISGTGFGKFTDLSETPMEYSEIYGDALNYVHQIANKIGDSKPKQKIVKEDGKVAEAFDINKHGFQNYFLTQLEPFNTTGEFGADVITGYRNQFENDLSKAILDFNKKISEYQTKYNNFKDLDFSTSLITAEEYNQGLEDLKKGLADGNVDAVDRSLARRLNVSQLLNAVFGSESNPILSSQKKDKNPNIDSDIIKARAFQKELQAKIDNVTSTDPTNSVSYLDYNKIESLNKNQTKTAIQSEKEWGDNTTLSNYWQTIKDAPGLSGIKDSDKLRFGALLADISSIIDPEPLSAAGLGYASDILNLQADNMDGINDSYWDDVLNFGVSTVGAVPVLGDVAVGWKAFKGLKKIAKVLIPVITVAGASNTLINSEEITQSIENLLSGNLSNVNDWRNLYTGITLLMGSANAAKSIRGFRAAKNAVENSTDALQATVKQNGKNQDIYITDTKGIDDLTKLKDKPDEFKKYLKDNYEGLDNIELGKINTTKIKVPDGDNKTWYGKPKKKTVETTSVETSSTKINASVPEKRFARIKAYMDDIIKGTPQQRKRTSDNTIVDENVPKSTGDEGNTNIPKTEETPIETGKLNTVEDDTPQVTIEKPKESQTLEGSTPASKIEANTKVDFSTKITSQVASINIKNLRKILKKQISKDTELERALNILDSRQSSSGVYAARTADDVAKKGGIGGTKEYGKVYQALISIGKSPEEAVQILRDVRFSKQGGILKAEGGIKFDNVDLLNHSKYQGWNEFFNYDITTGNLSLKPNYDKEKFNAWLTANNLQFNAPTKNYGNNYTIPEGDYTIVYNPNAMSNGLKGATNDKRAKNLIPSAANPDNEIDLNSHLKPMYDGDHEKNRVNDILNFYNNSGLEANDIDQFLNNYNKKIDQMYAYKRSKEGTTYDKNGNDLTQGFNQSHNSIYASHNDRYGYDVNTEHINGTATMARGVDITDNDIELDMSSDANFSKMLGNKKLYKAADGRLYYIDPATATLSTSKDPNQKVTDPDKPGVTHDMSGGGNNDKSSDPMPTKKDYIDYQVPISTAQLLGALYANKKMYEINNQVEPLLYSPKEDYRWTYGNLRAMVAGRKQAADLARQVARPLTSDGSLQTAVAFEAFNQGQNYIQEGERIDDETLTENMEKAWQQNLENHENRYNIAMKNRENTHQVDREKLLAKANWFRANYESIDNFTNAMKTLIVTDQRKKESMQDMYHQLGLRQWSERNPDQIVDNWGEYEQSLWEKGTSGQEMDAEEQANYNKLRKLVNMGYYRMLAADSNVYLTKPDAKSIKYPFNIEILQGESPIKKRGGKITPEMSKTIISFLKEKNKNYNKAIDRSIRGLYNHIKLQRK